MLDLLLLSKDAPIARIEDGVVNAIEPLRLPLFLKRTGDIASWLESRAIDGQRINSRLLKRALRLESRDDITAVLRVNAATITDNYWVKPLDDGITRYEDIRFKMNAFDNLALFGDVNSFSQPPSRTPELTNTGSFEKCWRLENGEWWMYKAGKEEELFSELLAFKTGEALGLPMAQYEAAGEYIKSRDFTENANMDFEPAISVIGDKSDYIEIYEILLSIGEGFTEQYVKMCYFDGLILNMDRHENNFGLLRNSDTGAIISLAPLYDHNISIVSRGYPARDPNDALIGDFTALMKHTGSSVKMPKLTLRDLCDMINGIPFEPPVTVDVPNPREFTAHYLLRRQEVLRDRNRDLLRLSAPKGRDESRCF